MTAFVVVNPRAGDTKREWPRIKAALESVFPLMTVAESGKGLELDGGGSVKPRDTKLPETGRKVYVGIRPEHLSPVQDLNADLKLAVEAVETLGADTLAHGRLADAGGTGGEMVARLPGTSAVKPGDVLPLAIEPGMAHLFDRESGKRISPA